MEKILILSLLVLFCTSQFAWAEAVNPRIRLETGLGDILLELDAQAAPKTVENFLDYANKGFYDGTIFHRVIKGFMIQGGGFTPEMTQKPTQKPITNEADNGLENKRGTIAMARTSDPHSATAQFFINTVDNSFLDYKEKSMRGWGYCVFGKVIEGMDVMKKIENMPTTNKGGHQDVPVSPAIIKKATVVNQPQAPENPKK